MIVNREQWSRLRRLIGYLRLWVDPKSYRPLVALAVFSIAVFLAPLSFDVVRAIFTGMPPWLRNAIGQAPFLALGALGLKRLWHVKATDSWPSDVSAVGLANQTAAARLIPWLLRLGVLSLAVPLLQNPDGIGFADWDFVLDKFEALRKSILIWGQFPWWNPWCRGGFPLAAEPQIGAVSIATPLVLALGTSIGLRVSAILCLLIAVEGTYRLASLWFRESCASAATALIFGLNGAVILDTAIGYVLAMSYCALPWLAYFTFRIGRRFADGLALGFWLAFVVMNGIQYLSIYAGLLSSLIWVRSVRVQPRERRVSLLLHTIAAAGVFLLLCGWRLSIILFVLSDDKREQVTRWDETPWSMIHYLLFRPGPGWNLELTAAAGSTFVELTCYVGPVVLALALMSLAFGWRWWHTLTLVCFWLAIGSVSWYQPSYWLARWPIIGSAHVVTRWRFVAILGLAFAVGSVLSRFASSRRWESRALAMLIVAFIGVDFLILGHQQFPLAFSVRPTPDLFPGPPVAEIVNVRDGLGYPCALRGYGIIRGYEPMLSYYRNAPTLRLAREDAFYRGEAWTESGPVRPVFWSPNRLVFQVEPGEAVYVNQNPSSWWWANGKRAFPGVRCAELMVPFVARADAGGRLELQIHPRGLALGIWLHILGAVLLAMAWLLNSRGQAI